MDKWLFIHVMKTAGTSFRHLLEKEYHQEVYPTAQDLRSQPNRHYYQGHDLLDRISAGMLSAQERRFICGHYTFAMTERFPDRRTAVFLRDPVTRTVSMLAHRRRHSPDFAALSVLEMLAIQPFRSRQIENYQTKVLGASSILDANSSMDVDQSVLKKAKDRIKQLDFLGLSEHFSDSLRLFERVSDTSFTEKSLHVNKGQTIEITQEEMAAIVAAIPYDIELARASAMYSGPAELHRVVGRYLICTRRCLLIAATNRIERMRPSPCPLLV